MILEQIIQEVLKVLGLFLVIGLVFYLINTTINYLFKKLDEKMSKKYNNNLLAKYEVLEGYKNPKLRKEHQDKLTKLRYGIKEK